MSNAINKILHDDNILSEITKRSFDEVDTNHSGTIELKELTEILNQISVDFKAEPPTDEELEQVFGVLDTDKSGTIDFIEFKALIKEILEAMLEQDK